MDTTDNRPRRIVGTGGTLVIAGAASLGKATALLLVAVGIVMAAWGLWPDLRRRAKLWRLVEAAFLPALLLIPALSILPSPPIVWPDWGHTLIRSAWAVALAASSAVVALYYVGRQRAATVQAPTSPPNELTQREVEWMIQTKKDLTRIQELQRDNRELTEEVERARGETATLTEERDAWRSEAVAWKQRFRYGSPLLQVSEITDAEAVAIGPQIEELLHGVDAVFGPAEAVWREVQSRCRDTEGNSPLFWLAQFVEEHAAHPARNAANLFKETLQFKRDSRAALAATYSSYRNWRRWIVRLGEMAGLESGWGGYKVWAEADKQFDADLDRKLGISQLSEVRDSVRQDRHPDDVMLPPPNRRI
jgi:FtsZ-binding cell division protein ZapB